MDTSFKSVIRKAEKLLISCFGSNLPLPIDLFKIADFLSIDIIYNDLDDDVSGYLLVEDNQSKAVINESHHPNRQRFTIAHEIGHYCLHVPKNTDTLFIDKGYSIHKRDKNSSLGTISEEREANLFASVLLMPGKLVKDVIENNDIDFLDDYDVKELSDSFGVSEQAFAFRLAKLKYEVGDI